MLDLQMTAVSPRRWLAVLQRHGLVVALAVASFAAALLVRRWLVPYGTGDADESAYVHLAALLRHGHVSMTAATHLPFFHPWLTGETNGRLFFQYEPGWPAALAASQVVFGSKVFAPALSAAALVVATYALAYELFRSRRAAAIGAALVTLSPIFLLHSAIYLSYVFTALLATAALLCTARALSRGSIAWAAGSGVALGAMLLTRPFDGVLTGVTVVLLAVLQGRSKPRQVLHLAVAVAVGALPFVVAAAIFNEHTTGSFTTFPLTASDPRDIIGFGDRGLQVGTGAIHYDVSEAWGALAENSRAALGWVFGGVVTFAMALFAASRREQRTLRLLLTFNVLLFPIAYFFWWASALTTSGATNGLGPHYYVPSFVTLCVLAADGYARLSRPHVAAAAALAMSATAVTYVNVPDKIDGQHYATAKFTEYAGAIPDDLHDAMVFIERDGVVDFTGYEFPFLVSDPDLGGRVLYPADRQGEDGWLIGAVPDRQAYLLHRELRPGDDLFHPHLVLTELAAFSGQEVTVRARVTPPVNEPLQAFVEADGVELPLQLMPSNRGDSEISIRLRGSPTAATSDARVLTLAPGHHDVRLRVHRENGERWIRLYRADVREDGTVTVVTPGTGEHLVDLGKGPTLLHEDVSSVIVDAHPR